MPNASKSTLFDPRKADALYKPFPSFAEWKENSFVETVRWDRYSNRLKAVKETSSADVTKVREAIEIAAAVDTGAIEGLYDTDRGFTYTVAFESAVWQSTVTELKGEKVRALIESQLNAFEHVLDFATKNAEIASAWIRELHAEVCKEQETYQAVTEIGIQNLPLPKGQYKSLPNHVLKQNEEIHSYAPVDLVAPEMLRLCDQLNSPEFQEAHPATQSAYSHYAFVAIHPFADGNGRVARALASVYSYRALSVPLLIFADSRENYRSALERADEGNYQSFNDFILDVALSSIQLFTDSLESTERVEIPEAIEKINKLYVTKGGYSHEEVDKAGYDLVDIFVQELRRQLESAGLPSSIQSSVQTAGSGQLTPSDTYRLPLHGGKQVLLHLSTSPPVSAQANRAYHVEVPKDCGLSDDVLLRRTDGGQEEIFEARASELIPSQTASLQMRVKLAVKRILNDALSELSKRAKVKF